MKKTKDFFILPFNSRRINGRYLVSNRLGGWDFLTPDEFRQLNALGVARGTPLFERLRAKGLVADADNVRALIRDFRSANTNLFADTSLHIAVVTTRCNLKCSYCQARVTQGQDMPLEVARGVLRYLEDVRNPYVTLELQGGEPLANWPVARFLIEGARRIGRSGKNVSVSLVSNLTLLDEAKMRVLADHDVQVCSSLDGPADIHDLNRILANGRGTYRTVTGKAREFKKKFGRQVSFLPTITAASLKHPRRIVDEYVRQGQGRISLRPVNNTGGAGCGWETIGYSPEEFQGFYRAAMEYILELNRKGVAIHERMARVILIKALAKKDPMYVDLMNPCGAGRAQMAYMPDGSCFPCDEARMIGGELFKLGNILEDRYQAMMSGEKLLYLLQASCADISDYASAFLPWTGYCPVVNYALQHNVVSKTRCSAAFKILDFQFEYIFGKLEEGGYPAELFRSWAGAKAGTRDPR